MIVTGLSGAGKSTALRCLEDMGFFCINNLPISFVEQYLRQEKSARNKNFKLAIHVDTRDEQFFQLFEKEIEKIKKKFPKLFVLYLTASTAILIRRFSETRRPHPLTKGKDLMGSIRKEKKQYEEMIQVADATLDTSHMNVHMLKQTLSEIFQAKERRLNIPISLLSFGYRYGIPPQCDLVFDTRFLPNPFFEQKLKLLTGKDKAVQKFVLEGKETREFVGCLENFFDILIPRYMNEGKSYLTIGFGCTGGKHRSVSLAEYFKKYFESQKKWVHVDHRDVYKK